MKRKVGKEPEGGSKKRKEVGNESPLSSMFQKQQTVNDLQKTRESYTAILEKGQQLGLDEACRAWSETWNRRSTRSGADHRMERAVHPLYAVRNDLHLACQNVVEVGALFHVGFVLI